MDESSPLPEPTPELIETLRVAAAVTDDVESRRKYQRLLKMLGEPTMPTAREAGASLSGEGTLSTRLERQDPAASFSGEGTLTSVTSTRAASWDVMATVTATRSTSWDVEAATKSSIDYAVGIAKWGGAALVVAKVIHEASETVILWMNARGR